MPRALGSGMLGSSRKALRIVSSATREMPPLPPSRRAISGSSIAGASPRSAKARLGSITIRCCTRSGLATA